MRVVNGQTKETCIVISWRCQLHEQLEQSCLKARPSECYGILLQTWKMLLIFQFSRTRSRKGEIEDVSFVENTFIRLRIGNRQHGWVAHSLQLGVRDGIKRTSNYEYKQIKHIAANFDKINAPLGRKSHTWNHIVRCRFADRILPFLEFFKEGTEFFQGEEYPTAPKLVPTIQHLQDTLIATETSNSSVNASKQFEKTIQIIEGTSAFHGGYDSACKPEIEIHLASEKCRAGLFIFQVRLFANNNG